MIKIRVPATSANMGPGFDSLGIALNLYNTYSFYYGEEDGEKSLMSEASDLVFQSIERTPEPVKVTVERQIPMSRGLGSSAACIVAGVMAANVYLNSPLGLTELLQLATQAEGHPDNVAPALFGGIAIVNARGESLYPAFFARRGLGLCSHDSRFLSVHPKSQRSFAPRDPL